MPPSAHDTAAVLARKFDSMQAAAKPPVKIDSLALLRHHVDSLQTIISKKSGFHIEDSPVQAALIVAFTTLLTVALGFYFKDFWIPGRVENRTKQKERDFLFAKYKYQLFHAASHLSHRLREIYRTRSHYLWSQASQSSFYDYKYKSSVYRLCVLLGWARAFKVLESSLTVRGNPHEVFEVNTALREVEACLADGQNVEMYMAKSICAIAGTPFEDIDKDKGLKLSVEIDNLIQRYEGLYQQEYICDMQGSQQAEFVGELITVMEGLGIATTTIADCVSEVVKEVSVKQALIYRDWQQAIGDLMLAKQADHSLDVITFRAFESLWAKPETKEGKKWLCRAEKIFKNLDMRAGNASDSRIEQIDRLYKALYKLMDALYKSKIGPAPVDSTAFEKIPAEITTGLG